MDALKQISLSSMKEDMPALQVGDYVKVNVKIREGEKERIQLFEGTIISMKHGGISETFTVRRVSHGCGVERVFPIHSPNVVKVDVLRHGRVRRAKLYYLRDRVGKSARVKEKIV
ncbi:MAG: 50S ribosomal protein L19 [Oscillospiraceae bacterium]